MADTRRDFLWKGAGGLGLAWVATHWAACGDAARVARQSIDEGGSLAVLGPDEAVEFGAIADRILPPDDGEPGAGEAGVIHFIDRAFEGFQADGLEAAREGLAELQRLAETRYPGEGPFSRLGPDRQDALLREIEDGGFFAQMRFLTVAGMFALPGHGGNRGKAGWRLLGFEDRFVWRPPFGHYDAEVSDA